MKFWMMAIVGLIECMASVAMAQQTPAAPNLIASNCGFELAATAAQIPDWDAVWSREPGGASGAIDSTTFHSGGHSFKVTSTGAQDWSFDNHNQLDVPANSLVTISAWIKSDSKSDAEISVVERSANATVINWMSGRIDCGGTHDWTFVHRTFGLARDTRTVQFRLTGSEPGTAWIDDVSLTISPLVVDVAPNMASIRLTNGALSAIIDPAHSGAMTVTLKSSSHSWNQFDPYNMVVASERKINASTAQMGLVSRDDGSKYTCVVHVEPHAPKILVTVSATASSDLGDDVEYPPAFKTAAGEALVIPTNEGLLYPADDSAVAACNYELYQGSSGLSMAWFGQVTLADGSGVMAIVRKPDDATLKMKRPDDQQGALLQNTISWEASKGKWAYSRTLEYIFLPSGGYVAQAKLYRAYAESIGLVKTLAQKRAANPNVDKLIGAADIWDWDSTHAAQQAQEFKDAGMDRVLWANAESADVIDKINQLGYLTSRYDVYQDEYEPSAPEGLPKGDWPNDLVVNKDGARVVTWIDYRTTADGKKISYTADACCSVPGVVRAEKMIRADLAAKHYNCRFIDTITASPWRECYSPVHPTTRSVDKQTKMKLLSFVSNTEHLVTGSETGIDSAVPYEDYFEGMMSLSHYRLPDSGYKVGVYQPPTPDFLKFQIGVGYRIPLFELVYHDCMIDTWYWGDASNQEPEVWRQRDLWNVLYGTSPIYVLDPARWASQKDRLAQSYKDVSTSDRAVAYAQMLSHAFLTPDHSVQQTRWSNGKVITVNFGSEPYASLHTVPPLGYDIASEAVQR
jgi:hypothetical protein